MNPSQQETLWIGAFRYYLGRQTYAVSSFCETLIQEWESLPEKTRSLIRKELEHAFAKDDESRIDGFPSGYSLGMDCDRAQWQKVLDKIREGDR